LDERELKRTNAWNSLPQVVKDECRGRSNFSKFINRVYGIITNGNKFKTEDDGTKLYSIIFFFICSIDWSSMSSSLRETTLVNIHLKKNHIYDFYC